MARLKNSKLNAEWKITRDRKPAPDGMFTLRARTEDNREGMTYRAGKGYVEDLFPGDEVVVYCLGRIQRGKFLLDYRLTGEDQPSW